MPVKSILASLLAVFMLAACETAPDPRYTGTGPLAVISAISDDFQIISIGTTVFQSTEGGVETDLEIDGAIEAAIKKELAGAFEFVESTADRDAIAEETDAALKKPFGPYRVDYAKIVGGNVQFNADNAPSAILLIAPAEHDSYGARGNPRLIGAGMYSDSFFGMRNTSLYLGAQLVLLDAQSMEILRQRLLKPGVFRNPKGKESYCFDCSLWTIDNALHARSLGDMSTEQKEAIKEELYTLIDRSVSYTLQRSGLTPPPVEPTGTK